MSAFWKMWKSPRTPAVKDDEDRGEVEALPIDPELRIVEDEAAIGARAAAPAADDEEEGERLIEDTNVKSFTKEVTRTETVPFTRRVKVPIKAKKIVDTTYTVKVKSKKSVEVPTYEEVVEKYTDMKEVTAVREKEVWVKKIVRQEYKKMVPVERERKVRRKSMRVEEHEIVEEVEVPGTKLIEIDAYRIDEVDDFKTVEIVEQEEYEMVPTKVTPGETRIVGEVPPAEGASAEPINRRFGEKVYFEGDEEVDLDALEEEEDDDSQAAPDLYTDRDLDSIPRKRGRSGRAAGRSSKRQRRSYAPSADVEGEMAPPSPMPTTRTRATRSSARKAARS